MEVPLLQTKLYIPSVRTDAQRVSRPRLIERLDAGLRSGKLTLISAPAGFGKTTLVSEWVQALGGTDPPIAIAWLSLDESDNDLTRCLTYLIGALQTIQPDIGQGVLSVLRSPQPPPAETILTALINKLAALPDRIVLVLDDYHLIEAQPIQDTLAFLLQHLPPNLHLVIATREDPPLPLARLRARGQLTELRATNLRFTSSEAAEFLNQVMGLDLSAEDIAALEARTEGWIAGLQLAAMSMQGRTDVAGFIQSFTGSHHFVLDYLVEEVLEQQSESVQSFLLHTSILDRLTGSLCDALTGQEDGSTELRGASCRDTASGQATLEMLERANLFIVPLDDERQWYRYHHLFADLLRQQLQRTESHLVPRLHHQASIWLEQNGFLDEAIKHALLANDFTRSAVLIADLADPLWKRGEHVKLRLWLAKLPEEALCVQPKLCIYQAWFLFSTGQQEPAQQLLQVVEQNIDSGRDDTRLRGWLGAIWSQISYWKEDIPGIARYGGWAIEYLPPGDPWRNMAATALGDARYYQGDVQAAYQTRLETLAASRPEDDLFFYMVANLKVASSLRALAKLNQVIEICRQQLEFATRHGLLKTVFVGWALAIWAVVLAEQNELDQALEFAHQSLELNLGGDYALLSYSYLVLAIVYFRRGDYHNAEVNLRTLTEIQQTHYVPFNTAGSSVGWQARVMLAQSRLDEAAQWIAAQDCEGDEKLFMTYDHVIVVRARLLLSQGNLDEAASLLARLGKACKDIGHTTHWIEILVLQALTHHMADRISLAHQYLEQALALAEPGGFIRTFVDEGPPMARLLYEALSRGIAPNYTRRLLAAFPVTEPGRAATSTKEASQSELIEPLSERELEVLALLAEGLTNREIASRLFLAPNTVKAHTGNIYGKLDVHNRTQAVARARTLGLLPSI